MGSVGGYPFYPFPFLSLPHPLTHTWRSLNKANAPANLMGSVAGCALIWRSRMSGTHRALNAAIPAMSDVNIMMRVLRLKACGVGV